MEIISEATPSKPEVQQFRLFYVSAADTFEGYEVFEGATDVDALDRARKLLVHRPSTVGIEIWDRGRLVGRVGR